MNEDLMERPEMAKNAKGGTELQQEQLYSRLPRETLERFQIFFSRVGEFKQGKIPILFNHDLPGDPAADHLRQGGWNRFKKIVFVSHWQQQMFNQHYGLPYSKSIVMQNAIVPIPVEDIVKPTDKIKLIYHTTPHRGLQLLIPVFTELAKKFPEVELDVYSSFKIYGWEERDKEYEALFQACRDHPQINYHGTVSNEEVKKAVAKAHIFAYPSIWKETSCISLMEAMSAKCICVHPTLAALPETSANLTAMYPFTEDSRDHVNQFYSVLHQIVVGLKENNGIGEMLNRRLDYQKNYIDSFFNWDYRALAWKLFLDSIK